MKILNIIIVKNSFLKDRNKGQAMLVSVVYFLFISLSVIFGIVSPSVREYKISNTDLNSKKSYYLAESGTEDAIYRIKMDKTINDSENLSIDENTVQTNIITYGGLKEIISLGNILNYNRSIFTSLNKGAGVSFHYGVLSGLGGFIMENESTIDGNVYSNGSILGSNGAIITETAISANFSGLNTSASNIECPVGSCVDRIFGQESSKEDVLQSMKSNISGLLSSLEIRIKKIEGGMGGYTFPDLVIRVVEGDSRGPFYPYEEIESVTLRSENISTQYKWVGVNFSENQELFSNKTYWIIIDSLSSDRLNYYNVQSNQSNYGPHGGAFGNYHYNSWTSRFTVGEDILFKIFTMNKGLINEVTINKDAKAYSVQNSTIKGNLDCKEGDHNNKSCPNYDPPKEFEVPEQKPMPITEEQIQGFKYDASLSGTIGSQTFDNKKLNNFGPKKIDGNLTVSGKDTILNLMGTVWVTGDILIDNNSKVILDSSYGSNEGAIIADGTIVVSNNASIEGSINPNSYIMALSTSASESAITISNNAGSAIIYAPNGTINLLNGSSAIELVGKTVHLHPKSLVTYSQGLVNSNFTSGPGGTWSIESWKEQ